ncbi:MAG: tetratricopeptide repeat protein [Dinoroseobacter sp.]|nr:tetratricopeptide repeat protein [Dinoroseobacter sp.]
MKKASAQQALQRAKALQRAGDIAGAKAALAGFLKQFPKNARVQSALKALDTPSTSTHRNAPLSDIMNKLRAAAQQGRLPQAAARALQLTRTYPTSAELWDFVGVTHTSLNKFDEAEAAFRKVVAQTPNSSDAHYKLGALLLARKKHADAIPCLSKAVALKPDFAKAQIALGTALMGQEDYEAAEKWLAAGLQARPQDAQAHNTLGVVLLELKRPLEAAFVFEKALEIDPAKAKYWANLGGAHNRCGAPEKAVVCYEKAVELWPTSPDVLVSLSSAKFELGQIPDAVEDCMKALEIDPSNMKAALQLANAPMGALPTEMANKLQEFASTEADKADAAQLLMIRSGALKHLGEFDESFQSCCSANELLNDPCAIEAWRESCRRTSQEVDEWTPGTGASQEHDETRLLIILGPSRSGKTTVEKLLSQSAIVRPFRENWQEESATEYLRKSKRRGLDGGGDITRLFHVSEEDLDSNGVRLVTSTNPFILNVAHLIHDTFKNALFLFVERDETRTAAEIFVRGYKSDLPFARSASETIEYVRWYRETGRILAEKMGSRALTVRYKDLVSGRTGIANDLERFLGAELSEIDPAPGIPRREDASPYEQHFKSLLA